MTVIATNWFLIVRFDTSQMLPELIQMNIYSTIWERSQLTASY